MSLSLQDRLKRDAIRGALLSISLSVIATFFSTEFFIGTAHEWRCGLHDPSHLKRIYRAFGKLELHSHEILLLKLSLKFLIMAVSQKYSKNMACD